MDIAKYLVSLKEIKEAYADNDDYIYRLLMVSISNENVNLIDHVLSELNISNEKVVSLIPYKYKTDITEFSNHALLFHRHTLLTYTAAYEDPTSIKNFILRIGAKALVDNIFVCDDWNQTALEKAVAYCRFNIIELFLSYDEIKDKYMNDDRYLWRLCYVMLVICNDMKIQKYLLNNLKGVENKIKELVCQRYQYNDGEFGKNARLFGNYTIIGMIAYQRTVDDIKYVLSIVGDEAFCDGVLLRDAWEDNAIEGAIEKKDLNMVKAIFSVKCVTQRFMDDKDDLHSMLNKLSSHFDESVAKYIIKELDLTESKLSEIKEYKDLDINQILTVL